MAREFFSKVEKNGKILNLTILGAIGNPTWWEDNTCAADVIQYLETLGELEEINLTIKSPGGSIVEGTAIYEALKQHKAKVNVKIIGECCSIATVIAMAGDKIEMADTAYFMIHNPMSVLMGNAEELRDRAELLDKLKENIINAYIRKSQLSREEISKLMDEETFFTAEEALKNGFITDIIKSDIRNAVNLALDNYKFTNKQKKESENMDIKELQNKHPELFKEVLNLGGEQERTRLQKLDNLAAKNNNAANAELINKAKYETFENASDIMETLFMNLSGENPNSDDKTNNKANDDKGSNFIDNFATKTKIVNKETELKHLEAQKEAEDLAAAVSEIVNIANEI